MLNMNGCSNCSCTAGLSQTQEGIVDFESEVAYDFLISSTTRGHSYIIRQNNGIIALIFEIWKLWVCSGRGNDSWKTQGCCFWLLFFGCISDSSSDFPALCLWEMTSLFLWLKKRELSVWVSYCVMNQKTVNEMNLKPCWRELNAFSIKQEFPTVFNSTGRWCLDG